MASGISLALLVGADVRRGAAAHAARPRRGAVAARQYSCAEAGQHTSSLGVCSSYCTSVPVHSRRILFPSLAWPLVSFSYQPDCLLIVYQCTRPHSPHQTVRERVARQGGGCGECVRAHWYGDGKWRGQTGLRFLEYRRLIGKLQGEKHKLSFLFRCVLYVARTGNQETTD